MSDLSPAAQAVWDAVWDTAIQCGDIKGTRRSQVAAALRAAADQVVPDHDVTPGGSKIWPCEPVPSIRANILAIADELEQA